MKNPTRIAVLGSTGNVGRRVVRELLARDEVASVVTINRREPPAGLFPENDARLRNYVVAMDTADDLEQAARPLLDEIDVVVATMGIGSGKGPVDLFRHVEVDLPSAFARAAVAAGATHAVLLTAAGTDIEKTRSWITPHVASGQYFHIKGLVERNFADAGFADGVTAFRPAGLLGTDHLPAFVDKLMPMVDWLAPRHWHSVHIGQLAAAIAATAVLPGPGKLRVVQGDDLFALIPGKRTEAR